MAKQLLAGSSQLMSDVAGDNPQYAHLRAALFYAVLLHLILVMVLPGLPEFNIPSVTRGSGINVFLKQKETEETFKQSLNQPLPFPESNQPLNEPAPGSASPTQGDEALVTEESPKIESDRSDSFEADSAGGKPTVGIRPAIRIDRAAIKIFAQQEAARYAKQNPEQVERFRRSFNSYRNYQRRNKVDSYKNQYGDYYVRNSSSDGDICYLQRPETNSDEFTTNTVYFYRCGKKPFGLELESN